MDDLNGDLRRFAQGCRGSMWQSRNETIRLCDEAADRIEALTAERDRLAAELAGVRDSTLEGLESELRSLMKGEYSSLSIAFNEEHACNYQTAAQWDDYGPLESRIQWVSEVERLNAIAENSVWTCQWYPDTPVGFYCLGASTLPALITAVRDYLKELGDGQG
jgi:hypothetical protein